MNLGRLNKLLAMALSTSELEAPKAQAAFFRQLHNERIEPGEIAVVEVSSDPMIDRWITATRRAEVAEAENEKLRIELYTLTNGSKEMQRLRTDIDKLLQQRHALRTEIAAEIGKGPPRLSRQSLKLFQQRLNEGATPQQIEEELRVNYRYMTYKLEAEEQKRKFKRPAEFDPLDRLIFELIDEGGAKGASTKEIMAAEHHLLPKTIAARYHQLQKDKRILKYKMSTDGKRDYRYVTPRHRADFELLYPHAKWEPL